jgi:multiple sugar transport system permease protein
MKGIKMNRFENKNEGALNSINMHRISNKVIYWGMFAVLFIIALICLLPPLWIFISSLKTPKELMQIPPALFPEKLSFEKFINIWKLLHFEKYYINTILIAAGSVIAAVVLNGLAGYVISCLKPRGSVAVLTAIIWTMLLPTTLSMVPLFKNMIDLPFLGVNLSNTYWPMWLCAGANAFNILLFKDSFDNLPISLVEAARLDGCGRMGVFGRIILPLSKPIIAVVSIFTVNGAWGDFLLPYLILTDRSKQTVMLQIYNLQASSYSSPIDQLLVAIVFAMIPPIIIFFFFQKFIMGGATVGGVKE